MLRFFKTEQRKHKDDMLVFHKNISAHFEFDGSNIKAKSGSAPSHVAVIDTVNSPACWNMQSLPRKGLFGWE